MGGRCRLGVVAALTIFAGAALAACGDEGTSATEREAAIIGAVITDFVLADQAPPAEGDPLPIVYLLGADGETMPADVQAGVVKPLKDDVDVRFVDGRDDAIVLDESGEPVMDEGVLVTMASPPPSGSTVQFEVEVYRSETDEQRYLVTVAGGGTRWLVRSAAPI